MDQWEHWFCCFIDIYSKYNLSILLVCVWQMGASEQLLVGGWMYNMRNKSLFFCKPQNGFKMIFKLKNDYISLMYSRACHINKISLFFSEPACLGPPRNTKSSINILSRKIAKIYIFGASYSNLYYSKLKLFL